MKLHVDIFLYGILCWCLFSNVASSYQRTVDYEELEGYYGSLKKNHLENATFACGDETDYDEQISMGVFNA